MGFVKGFNDRIKADELEKQQKQYDKLIKDLTFNFELSLKSINNLHSERCKDIYIHSQEETVEAEEARQEDLAKNENRNARDAAKSGIATVNILKNNDEDDDSYIEHDLNDHARRLIKELDNMRVKEINQTVEKFLNDLKVIDDRFLAVCHDIKLEKLLKAAKLKLG